MRRQTAPVRLALISTATRPVANRNVHLVTDLARLFDDTFQRENTRLLSHADAWHVSGLPFATEPVYLPADAACPFNRIVYAHGFFASALHEIAHWCVAGKERRRLVDYGYWYEPDNRNTEQQAEFERVEARPQALEMAFSRAARFPFRISVDNLSGIEVDRAGFEKRVTGRFETFVRNGFPPRAQRFINVLDRFYAHG